MTKKASFEAYNVTETCVRLGGISRKKLYDLIKSGDLKTFKIGTRRLISNQSLADFIKRRESAT